ncbi:MAG: TonB-dependent receptor, partial [Terriglobales bacterium]
NANWSGLSSDQLRQRVQEMRDRQGGGYDTLGSSLYGGGQGPPGGQGTQGGGGGPGGQGAGPGGAGGGRGPGGGGGFGGGGGGGGGPFMLGGGRGRFNFNRPHGTIYYSADDSALDAAPYSLTGAPQIKPSYQQNRFGGSLGGPLNIPRIYNGGQKTFFFVNYNGSRSETPFDAFSTVPTNGQFAGTTNERAGIFPNGLVVNNINPISQALLQYIPEPNLPGTVKNFHFVTAATSNSDDLNVRVIRSFGKSTLQRQRGPGGGRNNLNIGFHYHSTGSVLTNSFPSVGGTTSVRSFDIPVGYVRSFGKLTNNLRLDFNRNRIRTQNLYAFNTDVASLAGVTGVSTNPFDWGIPGLFFSGFSSLNDVTPLLRRDQTFTISDSMIWSHGKHTWRWGGDFRRLERNTQTASNPNGSFTFTGFNTGNDFADFLLGLPQLSTAQFGASSYHFRANSWDLFAQDEWRVRGNLTLNLGLRYEYVSPYSEINNQIANLLVSNFGSQSLTVTRVLPGSSGVPATLVRPDRNNFAPRIGIAWKPFAKTVVRTGYGINYNT